MDIKKLIRSIERCKDENITQKQLAEAWNCGVTSVSQRAGRKSYVTVDELIKACDYFEVPVEQVLLEETKIRDVVEIKYYECPKLGNLIKHKKITSVWLDREIVEDVWHKNPQDLRAIKMLGDSMDGVITPIKAGNVLIFDITRTNTLESGIFAYTSGNGETIFVAQIKQTMNSLIFSVSNPLYESYTNEKTFEELKQLNFKVIGRYLHNASILEQV